MLVTLFRLDLWRPVKLHYIHCWNSTDKGSRKGANCSLTMGVCNSTPVGVIFPVQPQGQLRPWTKGLAWKFHAEGRYLICLLPGSEPFCGYTTNSIWTKSLWQKIHSSSQISNNWRWYNLIYWLCSAYGTQLWVGGDSQTGTWNLQHSRYLAVSDKGKYDPYMR